MKAYLIALTLVLLAAGASAQNYQAEVLRVSHIIHNNAILDSLANLALENSGVLKALDEEMSMYAEEVLQKKRQWVSSFRFGVNLFSASTVANNNESITTLGVLPNVGLSLTIDPENLVNRSSYVRQSQHKLERSKYLRTDHITRVKREIVNHYYDYLTLLEAILLEENTLNTRKQHLYTMQVAFQNGTASFSDVMVVENQYNLWLEQCTKTRIEVLRKKRDIEILIGASSTVAP